MKIYLNTAEPNPYFSMTVTTPPEMGELSEKTIVMIFVNGMADNVPDNFGRWMIDTGRAVAQRPTIIIPDTGLILPSKELH